jgi:hypothetical protein
MISQHLTQLADRRLIVGENDGLIMLPAPSPAEPLKFSIPLMDVADSLRMMEPPSFMSGSAFCTADRLPFTLVPNSDLVVRDLA